jgi:hypothetical protein
MKNGRMRVRKSTVTIISSVTATSIDSVNWELGGPERQPRAVADYLLYDRKSGIRVSSAEGTGVRIKAAPHVSGRENLLFAGLKRRYQSRALNSHKRTMLQGSISLPMAALMAASVRVAAPSFMRALSR